LQINLERRWDFIPPMRVVSRVENLNSFDIKLGETLSRLDIDILNNYFKYSWVLKKKTR